MANGNSRGMETILEAIGQTPLIELKRSLPQGGARVFAKLERFNAGGSLKDRIVPASVAKAEKSGALKPGGTLVAATTGNLGISLALVGAVKKYKIIVTMPENLSLEKRRTLESHGVDVRLTPSAEGVPGAIDRARKISKEVGGFFLSPADDPETAAAHENTTAQEILEDLKDHLGNIAAFVAGVGTGGTLMGVGRALKKHGAKVIAVEPAGSPLLSQGRTGPHEIEAIGRGFVPGILDRNLIDEVITVSDEEAFEGARTVARKEGVLVGISCGAAFVGAWKTARNLSPEKIVVTVFPDGGERYFSTNKLGS